MSTLRNRPNQALIGIDVQNGVVRDAWQRDDPSWSYQTAPGPTAGTVTADEVEPEAGR